MRFHLDMWVAEFRAMGLTPDEADSAARQRFGSIDAYHVYASERAARKARWHRITNWFVEWAQDVRFALRHFQRARAFTAIAVLTLALGIGANTAIFSVVHHLLIAPLPYPNGSRIVALKTIGEPGFVGLSTRATDLPSDPPGSLLRAWSVHATRSFDMMAGVEQIFLSLLPNDQQDTVSHAFITVSFLPMLGAQPALGRTFRAEEELAGANRVAMISYEWWQAAYGGRRDVLGKLVEYDGNPYTIVGVMPKGFTIPMSPRVVDDLADVPNVWMPGELRDTRTVFGRLRPGVSAASATRELEMIANAPEARGAGEGRAMFEPPDRLRVRAMRAQDFLAPREVRTIEVLFAAVGALLLIACANVANLLLVRAWARRREFAVRLGLGAGRARLIRLALTESVLLATIGGVIGAAIAWQGLRVIIALRPIALDKLSDVRIEPTVLLWTAGISVFTGILFGGAAAFFVSSQNAVELLRGETRVMSSGGASRRLRSSLIAFEIALSVALLVATGLLVRSFVSLQKTEIGFDPHNLVSVDVLLGPRIRRAGTGREVRSAILQRLREIPGVLDVAIGMMPTAGFRAPSFVIETANDAEARPLGISQFQMATISGDYFRTSRIALVAGRPPTPGASDEAPMQPFGVLSEEVVVSRSFARRMADEGNALGMRVRLQTPPPEPRGSPQASTSVPPAPKRWSTVVGIANDVHLPGHRGELGAYQLYQLPVTRMPEPTYMLRFAHVPQNVESVLRQAIQSVNATIVVRRARVGDDYLREALAPTRFTLALIAAFAIVSLVLAVVGLYGSIAYAVSQRTRELGIRIALGASPSTVMRLVVADGIRVAAIGLAIGVAVSVASTQALASLLSGVTSRDPATFGAIVFLVALITLAASYVPARRAARLDPAEVLRVD
jgi:predicted permease